MLTTLPNRVSALLADPFHSAMRENCEDFRWTSSEDGHPFRKIVPLAIWEDDQAFYVEAEVPGIAIDHLDVSLEKGKLTIRGERKSTRETAAQYDERFYGQFERTIALNEWIDPDSIDAVLRDGVLQLKLLKKPESQRQRVKITQASARDMNRIEAESA